MLDKINEKEKEGLKEKEKEAEYKEKEKEKPYELLKEKKEVYTHWTIMNI